jgi:hypothetical protein
VVCLKCSLIVVIMTQLTNLADAEVTRTRETLAASQPARDELTEARIDEALMEEALMYVQEEYRMYFPELGYRTGES